MITVARLRKLIAREARNPRLSEEGVRRYMRRLRELGLLPAGKPGRGDDGSAQLNMAEIARVVATCGTMLPPKKAPDAVSTTLVNTVIAMLTCQMPTIDLVSHATGGEGVSDGVVLTARFLGALRDHLMR